MEPQPHLRGEGEAEIEPFHPAMAVDSGSFSALVTTATATSATAKNTRSPATAPLMQETEHHRHQQYVHKPRWNMQKTPAMRIMRKSKRA